MPKFGKYSLLLMNREIGPDLLKYVPGEKVRDLRTWIEAYRYWNQGGS
jgi:magnesium chelatase subunit H